MLGHAGKQQQRLQGHPTATLLPSDAALQRSWSTHGLQEHLNIQQQQHELAERVQEELYSTSSICPSRLETVPSQKLLQLQAQTQAHNQQQGEQKGGGGLHKVRQLQLRVLQLTQELQAGVARHLALQPLWLVFKHWQHFVHSQQVAVHLVTAAWERTLVKKCFETWKGWIEGNKHKGARR
jgi:hypothetical protein